MRSDLRPGRPARHAAALLVPLLVLLAAAPAARAQLPTTAPPAGIRENTPTVFALTGARLVIAPGRVVEHGTLVVRDGVIVAAGAGVAIPPDATVRDLRGRTIYAGLIDAYSELGMGARGAPAAPGLGGFSAPPPPPAARAPLGVATYWNSGVTPQVRAADRYAPDSAAARVLRSQGVVAALVAPTQGVIKGASALVQLDDAAGPRAILRPEVALHVALTVSHFVVPGQGRGGYPSSPMGAYAVARQAFYDADWYAQALAACARDRALPRPEPDVALAALAAYAHGARPVVIDARDELYDLRADRLGRELGLDVIVRGSGREYRRLDLVRAAGRAILVPVSFPKAPKVETPEQALGVELEDLMHWDLAPENPGRLARAGVTIALTSDGLDDKSQFLRMVRLAVRRGLPAEQALAALTVTPARLFGAGDRLGTLEPGKLASFIVTDGDLFGERTRVLEAWTEGERHEVVRTPLADPRGTWRVTLAGQPADGATLRLEGEPESLTGSLTGRARVALKSARLDGRLLALTFPGDSLGLGKGAVRLSGAVEDSAMAGSGAGPEATFSWSAARTAGFTPPPDTAKTAPVEMASFPVDYPLGAFGRAAPPAQPALVAFTHATVWTEGPQGRIEDGTVLVRRGKIAGVGKGLPVPPGALVVDAAGKHLTPGVIDSHSHTATDGGINEAGQSVTAEVRIGDFIDCNDINIYRQLAGGVTTIHVLHGSANTIGGQCEVIKLRWGAGPEEMKLAGAPPTIKFALGENVKEANDDGPGTRYPQTRMGVEQLLRDEFQAAREYAAAWREWNAHHRGLPPRRDLELDAMAEVLAGTRRIHCHSYRQDEILALLRVCDDYGVHIAALEHDLEGYKIADEMARRGIGGSTFSDWWAYKMEVQDAIPYNGALMDEAGVAVTFNSDSNEQARRLNSEAGKAVKYGGVAEEEALRFVTLNAARQMKIDRWTGSIEPGKDADLALWSGPPMSYASHCEQTWIDGRKYFDRGEDERARADADRMRETLVQKALRQAASEAGKPAAAARPWVPREDLYDEVGGEEEDGR